MTKPMVLENDQTWVETPLSAEHARALWIQAFLTAQSKLPKITKDTAVSAGSYGYSYATLPDILEKVSEKLRGEGLVLNQSVVSEGDYIGVETRIYHKAGHVETFGPVMIKATGDAKAAGSAITYARRYALCAALGIAPDEDDDGRAASVPERKEPAELTPWAWLWEESAVFKTWTDQERLGKITDALDVYAYKTVETVEQARTIMDWLKTQAESAEQAV